MNETNIQTPHNPYCRLVSTEIFDGKNFLELVFAIGNNGSNEGLEVYYHKVRGGHFHKSRRFLSDEIPAKYKRYYEFLSSFVSEVRDGHKMQVTLPNE